MYNILMDQFCYRDKLDVLNQSALDGKIKQKVIYQSIPLVCDLKRLRMKLKYGNEDKQDDYTAPGQTGKIFIFIAIFRESIDDEAV